MQLPQLLFKRKPDTNKGDYGHVFILAGSACFTGAACLCANAAMRAGAGCVTLGIPKSLHPVVASKLTEAMTLPLPETKQRSLSDKALKDIKSFLRKTDCLVIGPGLSRHPSTQRLVRSVLTDLLVPVVVDADALNALVGYLEILNKIKTKAILTPHPGEMARLLNIPVEYVQKNRKKVAKDFVLRYNIALVLKGFRTVVASKSHGIYVNRTGNPGMATAGSGDVLAGILGAFLAQGIDVYGAVKAAVYLHGLAGDLAAKDKTQASLIASDIIDYLPKAFKKCNA